MRKNKVDIITLGCSKNLVDSEQLMRQFVANGYTVEHDPHKINGEIVVVITCGFIGDAQEESINMILELGEAKKKGKIGQLYVMGCLTERFLEEMKQELPEVQVGDTVRVHVKIKEGSRERIQIFEGTVIAKKHGGIEETITVRRISYGVGCEKVFPVHSPTIVSVETVRRGKVRRAKLYYLRDRVGKRAKVKELI